MNNDDLWHISRDLWRRGAVTRYLEEQINGLSDAQGKPLPDHAKQFLMDVLYLRIKPPANKARIKVFSEHAARVSFEKLKSFYELDRIGSGEKLRGESPADMAINEIVKVYEISEQTVRDVIYPRKNKK